MAIALLSRVTNQDSTGHYVTLFETLRTLDDQFINFTQIRNHGDGIIPVFPRMLQSSHNFITLPQLTFTGFQSLRSAILRNSVHQVVIYDGAVFDFWLSLKLSKTFPTLSLVFNFHYAGDWADRLNNPFFVSTLRNAIHRGPTRNITWLAESERLATLMSSKLDFEVGVWPMFSNLTELEKANSSSKKFDVLIPPLPQHMIGWDLLFFESVVKIKPDLKVISQNHHRDADLVDGLTSISSQLTKQDYVRVVSESRFTVLPYDSNFHKWGSSGRFEDAVALHTFAIVPTSTAMASRVTSQIRLPRDSSAEEFALAYLRLSREQNLVHPESMKADRLLAILAKALRKHESRASGTISFLRFRLGLAALLSAPLRHAVLANFQDMYRWVKIPKILR